MSQVSQTSEVIRTQALSKRFGGVVVADNIDLDLKRGRIVGLIGPNGAGKTSLFNLISGAIAPDSGSILLNGHAIGHLPMHARARLGISSSRLSSTVKDGNNRLCCQLREMPRRARACIGR